MGFSFFSMIVPLKKDVKLAWTDKAREQIAIAKGEDPSDSNGSGTSTGGNTSPSGDGNQNQGGTTPTNPDNPGGDGTTDQN